MNNNNPLVSIIVTTLNEEKNIDNFLRSCNEQTYQNIEIIVVDSDKTTDKTKEIAKNYTTKVYSKGPERSAQRNFGVQKSSGKYIIILDADMILTPSVIQECIDATIRDGKLKAITIPEKSIGTSFWAKCKAFERNFYYLDSVDNSIEAARFFDKQAFNQIGGYDLNITGPEDWDVPERIYRTYPQKFKIKSYIIHNEGNVSLVKLIKKKFYYGRKASVYLEKNKISTVSTKTIYFMRPVFYKFWKEWLKNPVISVGTVIMLTCEFIGGALGYLFGKLGTR